MQMLSEDDLNLRSMSDEQLEAAWDLWFDLAQETNAFDPAYSHGVLVGWTPGPPRPTRVPARPSASASSTACETALSRGGRPTATPRGPRLPGRSSSGG
jgi:hypothetical protein